MEQTPEQLRAELEAAVQHEEKKRDKGPGTNRGVETMFRAAYRVQMELTALADNKANMMISINGIIISIIIAAVSPKLDTNPWLILPSTVFLVGTLVSIVFAILAARPRISTQPITLTDLANSQGNILFFGNFANMSRDDFQQGMLELMDDRLVMYETMIDNLYDIGSVLKKKFALLKVAYTSFMAALLLGVLSFLAVFVLVLPRGA